MFGLHPALAPLVPLWNAGRLAAVHATGLPAPNRSHFAAMEEVEDADPGSSARVGMAQPPDRPGRRHQPAAAGFSVGDGCPADLALRPGRLHLGRRRRVDDDRRRRRMRTPKAGDGPLPAPDVGRPEQRRWAGRCVPLSRRSRTSNPVHATSETAGQRGDVPRSDLGRALAEVARIIRGDVGVEVLTVDQGDWDHHSGLGTPELGRMLRNAGELAATIAAFFTDLGPLGRQGDPGDAQRVRSARGRERQRRPRPRLRQRDVPGGRRRRRRAYHGQLALARSVSSTPTCW